MLNKDQLVKVLSRHQPHLLADTPVSAAVMVILLWDEDDNIEILLTRRAYTLPTYAGDYSFPGGIRDAADLDLYATAVRELNEELAIPTGTYQLIGALDDFQDRFGQLVRPFVVMMQKKNFEKLHRVSPDEIAGLCYFPVHRLPELKDDPELHSITRRRPSYAFREGDLFVWGLTAGILVHLWNIIAHCPK